MIGIYVINEVEKEGLKFGGLYYHYKATKENSKEREMLKIKRSNPSFDADNVPSSIANAITMAQQKAYSDIYDMSKSKGPNPFDDIQGAIKKDDSLIDRSSVLEGDRIILLPYTGILDYEMSNIAEFSLIVLELNNNFSIGFLTLKKLVSEYTEMLQKGADY